MSGENIIKFYEEAKKNESLKKEFEKLKNQVESGKETKEESLAKKIVSLAKKNGFDFSEKELLNYMEEVKNTLSEEDLLEVSGGRMSAKAAGIGLMGTLMLSFATGAIMNFVNQNTGTTPTQQEEAILDNENKNEENENKDNTNKDFNENVDGMGTPTKSKVNFGRNFRGGNVPSGRSVTRQSKLRNLVTQNGETPTLNVSSVEERAAAPAPEVRAAKPETSVSETVKVESVKTTNKFSFWTSYYDLEVTVSTDSDTITVNQNLINKIAEKHGIKPEVIRSFSIKRTDGKAATLKLDKGLKAASLSGTTVTVNNALADAITAANNAQEAVNKANKKVEDLQKQKANFEGMDIIKYYNAIQSVKNNSVPDVYSTPEFELEVQMKTDTIKAPAKGQPGWNEFLLAVKAKLNDSEFKFERLNSVIVNGNKIVEYGENNKETLGEDTPIIDKYNDVLKQLPKAEKELEAAKAELGRANEKTREEQIKGHGGSVKAANQERKNREQAKKVNDARENDIDLNDFWENTSNEVTIQSVKTTNWFGKYYDLDVTVYTVSDEITVNQDLINKIAGEHRITPEVIRSFSIKGTDGKAVTLKLDKGLKAASLSGNTVTINNALSDAITAANNAQEAVNKANKKVTRINSEISAWKSHLPQAIDYFEKIESVSNNTFGTEWDLDVKMKEDVEIPTRENEKKWPNFLVAVISKLGKNIPVNKLRSVKVNGKIVAEYDDAEKGRDKIFDVLEIYKKILEKDLPEAEKELEAARAKFDEADKALKKEQNKADEKIRKNREQAKKVNDEEEKVAEFIKEMGAEATKEEMKVEVTNSWSLTSGYKIAVTLPEGETAVKLDYAMLEKLAKLTPPSKFFSNATSLTIREITFVNEKNEGIPVKNELADFQVLAGINMLERVIYPSFKGETLTVDATRMLTGNKEVATFRKNNIEVFAQELGKNYDDIKTIDVKLPKGIELSGDEDLLNDFDIKGTTFTRKSAE